MHGLCYWTPNTDEPAPSSVQKIAPLRIKGKTNILKLSCSTRSNRTNVYEQIGNLELKSVQSKTKRFIITCTENKE